MLVLIFDDEIAPDPRQLNFPPNVQVRVFPNADDCLYHVGQLRPDVVLMDYQMQTGYNGEQAIRDLRQRFGSPWPTIIGISSAGSLNRRMETVGADRAILKYQLTDLLWELEGQAREESPAH